MAFLHEILYASRLADDQDIAEVGRILARARANNARDGITGLLVFDGHRFVQHIEGSAAALGALLERLQNDRRHVEMQVLHRASSVARRYPRFDIGFAQLEDGDVLDEVACLSGPGALERFLAHQPGFDVQA